jgi:type VI secretion system secreted protein Hcp
MSVTSTKGGFPKAAMPVLSLSHEIQSTLSAGGTGQPVRKRQHAPISFRMELGPSTPRFLQAFVTNESLASVTLTLWRDTTQVMTVKLTNANVAQYDENDHDAGFQLAYQKIQWTWVPTGITAQDDWTPQP